MPLVGTASLLIAVKSGAVKVQSVAKNDPDAKGADVTITAKFEDFAALWNGELSLEAAYMTGQLKVDGNRVLLIDGWRPLRNSPEVQKAFSSL